MHSQAKVKTLLKHNEIVNFNSDPKVSGLGLVAKTQA